MGTEELLYIKGKLNFKELSNRLNKISELESKIEEAKKTKRYDIELSLLEGKYAKLVSSIPRLSTTTLAAYYKFLEENL